MEAIALEWSNKDRNMCNRYQLGAKAALLDNMYDLALGVGVVVEKYGRFSISTKVILV